MMEKSDWRNATSLDVGKLCTVWDLRQNPARHIYRFGILQKMESPGMAIVLLQWGPDEERDTRALEVPSSAVYVLDESREIDVFKDDVAILCDTVIKCLQMQFFSESLGITQSQSLREELQAIIKQVEPKLGIGPSPGLAWIKTKEDP